MEKLQELFKDEAFVKELFSKEEPEDAQAFLEEKGVSLTLDEVKELAAAIEKAASGELKPEDLEKAANGELSESDLEEVAGGIGAFAAIAITVIASGTITTGGVLTVVKRWRW